MSPSDENDSHSLTLENMVLNPYENSKLEGFGPQMCRHKPFITCSKKMDYGKIVFKFRNNEGKLNF
jgi:hypothetical protein